ncbi:MAG TPA: L-threonylcarbamoyladenylate synthase [Acidobacteriota bacterium]|nr:L-threonylcarbamoyladenylate synthase [Acidobacteriota bacterium]
MWVDACGSEFEVIERAAEVVRRGGVLLYPSDTIYGLGCNPFCESAVRRILEIKKRSGEKGLLVLVPSQDWLERLARDVDSALLGICDRFWPGPLTILLKARPELSRELTGGEGTIGIRQPANPVLQEWMERIPGPVVSTSANLSGTEVITSASELKELFGSLVDLFIQSSEPVSGTPSTVVDLTCTPPKILRQGPLGRQVERYLARSGA